MKTILIIVLFFGLVGFCFARLMLDIDIAATSSVGDTTVPAPASTTITIWDGDKEVGRLEWETGKLEFKGDAEESAKVFFNEFLKPIVDVYIDENCKKEK